VQLEQYNSQSAFQNKFLDTVLNAVEFNEEQSAKEVKLDRLIVNVFGTM